jgi:integrase
MMGLAETILNVKDQEKGDIRTMKAFMVSSFPDTIRALRIIDFGSTEPRRRKGFNLVKRESKKHGFLYYVRFSHNGKMLPTKWNTHTNDLELAERFARENKTRLVDRYLRSRDIHMYTMFENYYAGNDKTMTYGLCERCRKDYHVVIVNTFIPYLKQAKITNVNQITAATLSDFQDHLLATGIKPQSINNKLKPVKKIFAYLSRKGIIHDNPADRVRGVPVGRKDKTARGCYDLDKLKGVFNRRWKNKTLCLLNMLIYTTGMRNSEILRLRKEDILQIDGCRFINVRESKTSSGIRLVPLHDFVYRKVCAQTVPNGAPLFAFRHAEVFHNANAELARQLGVSHEELDREHITFYSGRHFFKTLMSREGLGEDIEEIFMGHKVVSNVAKLYNHRDKQGKKMMVKKAKQVFSIMDRCIFKTKP